MKTAKLKDIEINTDQAYNEMQIDADEALNNSEFNP